MSRYLPSLFVIIAILGGSFFAAMRVSRQTSTLASERASFQKKAEASQQKLKGKASQVDNAKQSAVRTQDFLSQWALHINEGSTPGAVGNNLSALAKQFNVLASRQPTPLNERYPLGSLPAKVQFVGFSVVGPYAKCIEWLGAAENEYLFARFEKVEIKTQGTNSDVELNVNLAFYVCDVATTPSK